MGRVAAIFFNTSDRRLRAGWRIAVFVVLFALLSRVLSRAGLSALGRMDKTEWGYWLFRGVVVVVAGTLVVWVVRRFIDRRTFGSLGLGVDLSAAKDLVVGFLISAVMIGVILAVCLAAGVLQIGAVDWGGGVLQTGLAIAAWFFALGLAIGWSEELAFRGYLLQNMRDGMGLAPAVVVSCALYGILHMANPHATVTSGVLIAVIGYLRIFGWLRTGQLWLSMGMHAGWDFLMGPVCGLTVSGVSTHSLVTTNLSGPTWLTGGSFGPEAGVVVLPALALGLVLMVLWTSGRERAAAPSKDHVAGEACSSSVEGTASADVAAAP